MEQEADGGNGKAHDAITNGNDGKDCMVSGDDKDDFNINNTEQTDFTTNIATRPLPSVEKQGRIKLKRHQFNISTSRQY